MRYNLKTGLIAETDYKENLQWLVYAEEADLLNVALFGFTAKAWREANPELAKKSNVRDYATINELAVLSNLETHNAQMIREGKTKEEVAKLMIEKGISKDYYTFRWNDRKLANVELSKYASAAE